MSLPGCMQTKLRDHTTLLKPYLSYFCSHCILHLHCPTWARALTSSISVSCQDNPLCASRSDRGLVVGTSGSGRRYNARSQLLARTEQKGRGREREEGAGLPTSLLRCPSSDSRSHSLPCALWAAEVMGEKAVQPGVPSERSNNSLQKEQ